MAHLNQSPIGQNIFMQKCDKIVLTSLQNILKLFVQKPISPSSEGVHLTIVDIKNLRIQIIIHHYFIAIALPRNLWFLLSNATRYSLTLMIKENLKSE